MPQNYFFSVLFSDVFFHSFQQLVTIDNIRSICIYRVYVCVPILARFFFFKQIISSTDSTLPSRCLHGLGTELLVTGMLESGREEGIKEEKMKTHKKVNRNNAMMRFWGGSLDYV